MPDFSHFCAAFEISGESVGTALAFKLRMLRGTFVALSLFLSTIFSGCGQAQAPTYSMQVTNVTPQNSSTSASESSTVSTEPGSLLFQYWADPNSQMSFDLIPLSESLSNTITYYTTTGDECTGHVTFSSDQNTFVLALSAGSVDCLNLNGNYSFVFSETSLTLSLVGSSTTYNLTSQ